MKAKRNRRAKGRSYGILISAAEAPLFGLEAKEQVIWYNTDWPASWIEILDSIGKLGKLAGGKWASRHDKSGYMNNLKPRAKGRRSESVYYRP